MDHISVAHWDEFQHYRKGKNKTGTPAWIKLYTRLLDKPEYTRLPDATKAHLIGIWLLAARTENKIPADPKFIAARIGATTSVRLDLLETAGFIESNPRILGKSYDDPRNILGQIRSDQIRSDQTQSRARRASAGPPPGFTAWWETYPRKVGKQAAAKAWRRLKLEPEAERIIAATVAHAKSEQWRRDGGQYVPNPLTYLNQGRYDDPPPDQQTSNVTPFKNYLLDEDGA